MILMKMLVVVNVLYVHFKKQIWENKPSQ